MFAATACPGTTIHNMLKDGSLISAIKKEMIKKEVKEVAEDLIKLANKVWSYKNAKLEKRDVYGILREIRDNTKTIVSKLTAIEKKLK